MRQKLGHYSFTKRYKIKARRRSTMVVHVDVVGASLAIQEWWRDRTWRASLNTARPSPRIKAHSWTSKRTSHEPTRWNYMRKKWICSVANFYEREKRQRKLGKYDQFRMTIIPCYFSHPFNPYFLSFYLYFISLLKYIISKNFEQE